MGFQPRKKEKLHLINQDLKYNKELYLITENGLQKIGYYNAQQMADEQDLDLVQIGIKENTPLCKLFIYEKFLYEQKKKKKHRTKQEIKEIKLSSQIAENDLNIKIKAAKKFIDDGDKVKVVLQYRGRENMNKDFYKKSLLKFIVMVEDFAVCESLPRDEGKKCLVILKKK